MIFIRLQGGTTTFVGRGAAQWHRELLRSVGRRRKPCGSHRSGWLRSENFGVLARLANDKEVGENRNERAFIEKRLQECTAHGCGDLEGGLVSLDLRDHVSHRDRVPLPLKPFRDDALFHRIPEFGHFNWCRHLIPLAARIFGGPIFPQKARMKNHGEHGGTIWIHV
jgi:hypothetical protein